MQSQNAIKSSSKIHVGCNVTTNLINVQWNMQSKANDKDIAVQIVQHVIIIFKGGMLINDQTTGACGTNREGTQCAIV